MADNPDRRRPEDSSKISLTQKWEVDDWTKEFGVTEQQLRDAVVAAGHGSAKVRAHLKK